MTDDICNQPSRELECKIQRSSRFKKDSSRDTCCVGYTEQKEERQIQVQQQMPSKSHPQTRPLVVCADGYATTVQHPAIRMKSWLYPLVVRYNGLFTKDRAECMDCLQASGLVTYERCQRTCFRSVHELQRCLREENAVLSPRPTEQQLGSLIEASRQCLLTSSVLMCSCCIDSDFNRQKQDTALSEGELNCIVNLLSKMCALAWEFLMVQPSNCDDGNDTYVWFADVDHSAKPGDQLDSRLYRRSFDSDGTATRIHHYVWPCILLYKCRIKSASPRKTESSGDEVAYVLVKGESCVRHPNADTEVESKPRSISRSRSRHGLGCKHCFKSVQNC